VYTNPAPTNPQFLMAPGQHRHTAALTCAIRCVRQHQDCFRQRGKNTIHESPRMTDLHIQAVSSDSAILAHSVRLSQTQSALLPHADTLESLSQHFCRMLTLLSQFRISHSITLSQHFCHMPTLLSHSVT
jgi:hypothetical protein